MSKQRNPFEHHHDHGHDHDHDHGHEHGHEGHDHGLPAAEMDPAQQSLADALRVSFTILKVVMVVLLVVYAFTGFFNVPQQTVAMRLRFGQIVNEHAPSGPVIPPGGPHFAWPYPIEDKIFLPTSERVIELVSEFWHSVDPADEANAARGQPLNPQRDGALITGDANLIHARFNVSYLVDDPVQFMKQVGNLEMADQLVQAAAERAAIYVVAHHPTDRLILSLVPGEEVREAAQQILTQTQTGLRVTNVAVRRTVVPVALQEVYTNIARDEQDKSQIIERALTQRAGILGSTAGEAHEALWEMIQGYQAAVVAGDQPAVARYEAQLDRAFRDLDTGPEHGNKAITGQVSQLIGDATDFRRSVNAQMQGEVGTFKSFFAQYQDNPEVRRIIMVRLAQDAKQDVLTGDVETLWLPPGQKILYLSPDPNVKKQRDDDRLRAENQARGIPTGQPPRP